MIRIGQVSNFVNAVYTTATGTVDDYMGDIVEPKRVSFHRSMDKGEAAPSWNEHELRKELANTIVSEFEKKQGQSKIKKLASV